MGKVLIINPDAQVSLHYHEEKEETMILFAGIINVYVDETEVPIIKLIPGGVLHLKPGEAHSMKCVSTMPAVLFEASTPYPDDSIRIKDYYGRDD